MDILCSMIAFFVLVGSWFVLPAAPRTKPVATRVRSEGLPEAA